MSQLSEHASRQEIYLMHPSQPRISSTFKNSPSQEFHPILDVGQPRISSNFRYQRGKIFIYVTYLIFVIFFTQAKFLENKIYTKKNVNYDKILRKLPFFLRYYGKIHSKLPIFALNLSQLTPAKKNLHGHVRGDRDKYQV